MLRHSPVFLLVASLATLSACTSDPSATAPDVGERLSSVSAMALGSAITFHSNRLASGTDHEIYVMNPDGTNVMQLTDNTFEDVSAVTSPDGSKIAFASNRDGNYNIYVMKVDGSNQVPLTSDGALDAGPTWSPDGSKIAFTSERSGTRNIYVMNSDGSGQTNISNGLIQDEAPSWSPDGTRIVFSCGLANGEVCVMNADGSNQVNISGNIWNDTPSDWSPDGTKILFMSNRDDVNYELYTMNTDGSGVVRLTFAEGATDYATEGWSPDGAKILFATTRDAGIFEVYVMNADGSNPVNLTMNGASDGGANWGVPVTFVPTSPNPTTVEQCKKDGWIAYGFINQGQCVRYVQTGKDSRIP